MAEVHSSPQATERLSRAEIRDVLAANIDNITSLFREWDVEQTGMVCEASFRRGLELLRLRLTTDEAARLYDECRTTGDQEVNYDKLRKRIRKQTELIAARQPGALGEIDLTLKNHTPPRLGMIRPPLRLELARSVHLLCDELRRCGSCGLGLVTADDFHEALVRTRVRPTTTRREAVACFQSFAACAGAAAEDGACEGKVKVSEIRRQLLEDAGRAPCHRTTDGMPLDPGAQRAALLDLLLGHGSLLLAHLVELHAAGDGHVEKAAFRRAVQGVARHAATWTASVYAGEVSAASADALHAELRGGTRRLPITSVLGRIRKLRRAAGEAGGGGDIGIAGGGGGSDESRGVLGDRQRIVRGLIGAELQSGAGARDKGLSRRRAGRNRSTGLDERMAEAYLGLRGSSSLPSLPVIDLPRRAPRNGAIRARGGQAQQTQTGLRAGLEGKAQGARARVAGVGGGCE